MATCRIVVGTVPMLISAIAPLGPVIFVRFDRNLPNSNIDVALARQNPERRPVRSLPKRVQARSELRSD
jgi:hypothetical protein